MCSGIRTLFEEGSSDPSRISSIPPNHDSYGIPNKIHIILSATYRIPNFALHIYYLTSEPRHVWLFSALFYVDILFPKKTSIKF